MFSNISQTLKVTAKIFWVLGICTIVGIVAFWPLAFVMYGLGELIEQLYQIEKNTRKEQDDSHLNSKLKNEEKPEAPQTPPPQAADINAVKAKILGELKDNNSGDYVLKEKLVYSLKYATIDATVSYLSIVDSPAIKTLLTLPKEEIRGTIQEMIDSLD